MPAHGDECSAYHDKKRQQSSRTHSFTIIRDIAVQHPPTHSAPPPLRSFLSP